MSTETQTSMTSSSREPREPRNSGSSSRHTTASKSGGMSEKTIHFRTKPCTFFFTARGCVKGSKCNFRHDKLEVDPVQTSSAYSISDCEPAPREQRRRRPAQNVAVGPRLNAESVSRLGSTNKTHPIKYRTIGGGVMVGRASTGSSPPSPATPLDPQPTLPNSLVPDNDCQLPPNYEDVSDSTMFYESSGNAIPLPAYIPLYIPHATALGGVHPCSTHPPSIGVPSYYHYNPYLPPSPVQPHAMLAPPMLPLPYPHPPLPGTLWVTETPARQMLGSSPVFISGQAELPDVVCGLYADPGGLVIPLRSPVALPMYAGTGAPIEIPRPSSAPPPSDSFLHTTWLGDEHSRRVSLQGGL